nr:uncharacterized protein LOC123771081 [Procambarus clarkii]XP_045619355.1 uncharacterized protein LOC123771081 [Procambarus clarkii]
MDSQGDGPTSSSKTKASQLRQIKYFKCSPSQNKDEPSVQKPVNQTVSTNICHSNLSSLNETQSHTKVFPLASKLSTKPSTKITVQVKNDGDKGNTTPPHETKTSLCQNIRNKTTRKIYCYTCERLVVKNEIYKHLYFGNLQCKNCTFKIEKCQRFPELFSSRTNLCKKTKKRHEFTKWITDAVQYISYSIRKDLTLASFCTNSKNSPSFSEINQAITSYIKTVLFLGNVKPWKSAILVCKDFLSTTPSAKILVTHPKADERVKGVLNRTFLDVTKRPQSEKDLPPRQSGTLLKTFDGSDGRKSGTGPKPTQDENEHRKLCTEPKPTQDENEHRKSGTEPKSTQDKNEHRKLCTEPKPTQDENEHRKSSTEPKPTQDKNNYEKSGMEPKTIHDSNDGKILIKCKQTCGNSYDNKSDMVPQTTYGNSNGNTSDMVPQTCGNSDDNKSDMVSQVTCGNNDDKKSDMVSQVTCGNNDDKKSDMVSQVTCGNNDDKKSDMVPQTTCGNNDDNKSDIAPQTTCDVRESDRVPQTHDSSDARQLNTVPQTKHGHNDGRKSDIMPQTTCGNSDGNKLDIMPQTTCSNSDGNKLDMVPQTIPASNGVIKSDTTLQTCNLNNSEEQNTALQTTNDDYNSKYDDIITFSDGDTDENSNEAGSLANASNTHLLSMEHLVERCKSPVLFSDIDNSNEDTVDGEAMKQYIQSFNVQKITKSSESQTLSGSHKKNIRTSMCNRPDVKSLSLTKREEINFPDSDSLDQLKDNGNCSSVDKKVPRSKGKRKHYTAGPSSVKKKIKIEKLSARHEESVASDTELEIQQEKFSFISPLKLIDGRYLVLRSPQKCPDECPECYCSLYPSNVTVSCSTFVIQVVCPGCSLHIYILPVLKERLELQKRIMGLA